MLFSKLYQLLQRLMWHDCASGIARSTDIKQFADLPLPRGDGIKIREKVRVLTTVHPYWLSPCQQRGPLINLVERIR